MLYTLILGGLTNHYIGSSLPFCNRINNVGTIINPYAIALVGNENAKFGAIVGTDSMCNKIAGPISSFKLGENFDFVLGAYNNNYRHANPKQMESLGFPRITPVLGVNYKISLYKSTNFSVELNNVLSLGITTHALAVNF